LWLPRDQALRHLRLAWARTGLGQGAEPASALHKMLFDRTAWTQDFWLSQEKEYKAVNQKTAAKM
jgi:hypothetical protein